MIANEADATEENLALEMRDIAKRLKLKHWEDGLYFPKYFQLETTRICNARCPFCPVDIWDKKVPFIPDVLFDKVIAEMSGYSDWIESVALQRAGEPLLDKKIYNRVKKLKDIQIKHVTISTNISGLNETNAHALIEAGLDEIMFSIDSVTKENYEATRVGLDYEQVLKNIRTFFKLRDALKPELLIRVRGVSFYDLNDINQRKELQSWEDFWQELKKPHDRIYMKKAHNWGNQKIWEGHSPSYDWVYHPCILPWSTMHITTMGKVALCPQDYDALADIGDLHLNSIAEIWNNEKWMKIRSQHMSGKRNEIGFCQGCRLFDIDNNLEDWQQRDPSDG